MPALWPIFTTEPVGLPTVAVCCLLFVTATVAAAVACADRVACRPEPPPPPPPPPPPFVPDLSKPHILPPEFSPEPADYEHHVLPFTKRFLALGLYGEEVLGTRADQWIAHMQWIRRTALLGSVHLAKIREQPVVVEQVAAGDSDSQNPRPETQIPKSPDVQIPRSSDLPILSAQLQIIHAFTILSADRTTPIGQIVLAAANTTEVVQAYCDIDPLQCNEVLQWHVAEMDVTDHELLRGDVYSPFVFLSLPRFPDTQTQTQNPKVLDFQSPKPPDLVREARKYHLNCAEDMSLPAATARYNNLTRIVMHATLHATEDPQGCAVPELGEFVYFNAHTNRDALRYLSGDAFARERHSLNESSYAIVLAASGAYPLAVGDGMVASPVNILDVDGLHHAMPYDGWDYGILTQVHSQEPEDLLKQTVSLPAPALRCCLSLCLCATVALGTTEPLNHACVSSAEQACRHGHGFSLHPCGHMHSFISLPLAAPLSPGSFDPYLSLYAHLTLI